MAPQKPTPRATTAQPKVILTPARREEILQERADRRKLIEKPFPRIQYLGKSYPWAGTLIVRDAAGARKPAGGRDYAEVGEVTLEELVTLAEA